jgi:hypothetical protein
MGKNVTRQLIEAHLVKGGMDPGDEIGLRIDQNRGPRTRRSRHRPDGISQGFKMVRAHESDPKGGTNEGSCKNR